MPVRLRQIALVAASLEPVVDDLCEVLGLEGPFHDPGVATFGLRNAVLPVGDTFLEVVSPTTPDATAARFLARRGGDGGYMVILQVDDLDAARKRLADHGVRVVWEVALEDIATIHLHPRDVGGAIVSLDAADPPESWRWGGPDWPRHRRTDRTLRIIGAEIQGADPEALARRWAEVIGRPAVGAAGTPPEIPLDGATVRFVAERDGRGEGLSAVAVETADAGAVRASARARGIEAGDDWVRIGGVRFDLLAPNSPP